jgi:hypothetical protein
MAIIAGATGTTSATASARRNNAVQEDLNVPLPPNNAFERSVRRHRVRAAGAARHHAPAARSRAHRAAAQRER